MIATLVAGKISFAADEVRFLIPQATYCQFVYTEASLSEGGIDAARIARSIELTRFPVPDDDDHTETDTEAGLVRAADLIGQLGDPLYPRKLNALYYEFAEIGINQRLGYVSLMSLNSIRRFSGARSSLTSATLSATLS